jgi:hypothetical protein
MLPYGMIGYNGAPAELRDVPHGPTCTATFTSRLPGEEETIPAHQRSPHNHAITLEDDFSYYQRRGKRGRSCRST